MMRISLTANVHMQREKTSPVAQHHRSQSADRAPQGLLLRGLELGKHGKVWWGCGVHLDGSC